MRGRSSLKYGRKFLITHKKGIITNAISTDKISCYFPCFKSEQNKLSNKITFHFLKVRSRQNDVHQHNMHRLCILKKLYVIITIDFVKGKRENAHFYYFFLNKIKKFHKEIDHDADKPEERLKKTKNQRLMNQIPSISYENELL